MCLRLLGFLLRMFLFIRRIGAVQMRECTVATFRTLATLEKLAMRRMPQVTILVCVTSSCFVFATLQSVFLSRQFITLLGTLALSCSGVTSRSSAHSFDRVFLCHLLVCRHPFPYLSARRRTLCCRFPRASKSPSWSMDGNLLVWNNSKPADVRVGQCVFHFVFSLSAWRDVWPLRT